MSIQQDLSVHLCFRLVRLRGGRARLRAWAKTGLQRAAGSHSFRPGASDRTGFLGYFRCIVSGLGTGPDYPIHKLQPQPQVQRIRTNSNSNPGGAAILALQYTNFATEFSTHARGQATDFDAAASRSAMPCPAPSILENSAIQCAHIISAMTVGAAKCNSC